MRATHSILATVRRTSSILNTYLKPVDKLTHMFIYVRTAESREPVERRNESPKPRSPAARNVTSQALRYGALCCMFLRYGDKRQRKSFTGSSARVRRILKSTWTVPCVPTYPRRRRGDSDLVVPRTT